MLYDRKKVCVRRPLPMSFGQLTESFPYPSTLVITTSFVFVLGTATTATVDTSMAVSHVVVIIVVIIILIHRITQVDGLTEFKIVTDVVVVAVVVVAVWSARWPSPDIY
jgi:hypothetical protein